MIQFDLKTPFSQLKEFFAGVTEYPNFLETVDAISRVPEYQVRISIESVERLINEFGTPKKSDQCNSKELEAYKLMFMHKKKLVLIANAIQDKSNWMERLKRFDEI